MKAFDFIEPYLRAVLGFLGITNVDVVRVEGVAASAIGPEKSACRREHAIKTTRGRPRITNNNEKHQYA
jgi:FMN-dependent NADH-azoreductase